MIEPRPKLELGRLVPLFFANNNNAALTFVLGCNYPENGGKTISIRKKKEEFLHTPVRIFDIKSLSKERDYLCFSLNAFLIFFFAPDMSNIKRRKMASFDE